MSKYCKCKDRIHNTHEESCAANYTGSSGGMETAGVEEIYNRSQNKYDLRYTQYLGDGDSKAFSNVKAKNPYGDDVEITKLDVLGM